MLLGVLRLIVARKASVSSLKELLGPKTLESPTSAASNWILFICRRTLSLALDRALAEFCQLFLYQIGML